MNKEKLLESVERIFHDQWLPIKNTSGIINVVYDLLMSSGLSGDEISAIEYKAAKRAVASLEEFNLDASHVKWALSNLQVFKKYE